MATRADGRRVLVVRHPSALLRADRADLPRLYEFWKGLLDRATPLLRPLGAGSDHPCRNSQVAAVQEKVVPPRPTPVNGS